MDYTPAMWLLYPDSVTLVNDSVSVWGDTTGNGNDFAQATVAKRPLGVAGVGVDFDGVDDALPLKTGSTYGFAMNATIFIRMRVDENKDVCPISSDGTGTKMVLRYNMPINNITFSANGSADFQAMFTADTSTILDSLFHVYTFTRTDSTGAEYYLDGVSQNRESLIESNGDIEFDIDGIGFRQDNDDFELNGAISEIIWFESVLATADRLAIEYYLTNGEFESAGYENRFNNFFNFNKSKRD
ncbi:unnamed protein product [marine sediment metagenome]|uniref:LamG-like jellyroll fold domain-containing protein n=1 Tax=marine sediment metagenome TaxID=412755 RepID=X0SSI5_9ZZZZ